MGKLRFFVISIFSLVVIFGVLSTGCENPIISEIWELKTVTFNSNGGTSVSSQSLVKGQTVKKPLNPVKRNFRFTGWFLDNGVFSQEWDFNVSPTKDLLLHANWIDWGISLNPAGAYVFPDAEVDYIAPPAAHDVTVTNITNETFDISVSVSNSDFDVTPLGLLGTFDPGGFRTVSVVPKAGLPVGTHSATVTVSGGGYSASINVSFTVLAASVTSMTLISNPIKLTYIHDETLDLTGLELELVYSNGDVENLTYPDPRFATHGITTNPAHGAKLIRYQNGVPFHDGLTLQVTYPGLPPEPAGTLIVNKAAGADVSAPEIDTYSFDGTHLSITIKQPTLTPATGQSVQYAVSTGTLTWQSGRTFDSLTGLTYTLHAQALEDDNYFAGTANSTPVVFYNVTFDENGGSTVPDQVVLSGDKAKAPTPPPTLADHTFGGWYVDTSLTILWDFNNPVTSDMDLYAKWDKNPGTVTITLNVDNPKDITVAPVDLTGIKKSPPETRTVEISNTDWYAMTTAEQATVKWEIEGAGVNKGTFYQVSTGQSAIIDASDTRYNFPSTHVLILTYTKGGLQYRVNIGFTIVD